MTRKINSQYFGGAGEHSERAKKMLHDLLDEGLSTLSAMQQPGHPETKKEAEEEEKFYKEAEAELKDIAEDIYCALLGAKS